MATPSNDSGADTPSRGQVRKQPPDEHATKDDMEHTVKQMEDRMNQNITTAVQTAGAELRHSTMETIRDTMQAMETSLGNRIDRNALDINELTRRMDAFEQTGRQTESQINNLRTAVAAAESAVPVVEALDLEDFDLEPDLSIVRLRAQDAITQESLLKAVVRSSRPWTPSPPTTRSSVSHSTSHSSSSSLVRRALRPAGPANF